MCFCALNISLWFFLLKFREKSKMNFGVAYAINKDPLTLESDHWRLAFLFYMKIKLMNFKSIVSCYIFKKY